MSLTSNLMVHSDIVAPYILHLGSEEQKRKYLPQMISGECFGALAMTEPGTGSDLQAIKTKIGRATSELQSLMRISYAVFCLKKKKNRSKNIYDSIAYHTYTRRNNHSTTTT